MKKNSNTELENDVEKLAKQSIAAEVESKVFAVLERAMGELDVETRELLEDHFNGTKIDALAESRGLKKAEAEEWLKRAKRDLNNKIRTGFSVRH
jgi:hypothetical protein